MLTDNTTSLKRAIAINFIGKYSNIFLQLIFSSILARLLTPDDFGIFAVVSVFTAFFSLIADMGIGPAIIQNKELTDSDTNIIFSFTLFIGIAIGLLFALFSFPLSAFYQNPIYVSIGVLLSVSLFFNTLNIVPNALLLKEHRFKLVNFRLVIISVLSAIPTIILAFIGFRYYSIVIQSILISVLTFIWNLYTVKIKFVWQLNKDSLNKIRSFSTYQFAFGIINYFSRNLDNILIGKFMGSAALGYYDKSYRLMLYPVQNLTHVITPVLHPILSVHQDDKDYIYDQYMKVVKILSLLGVFVTLWAFNSAKEIVLILYGDQWVNSIQSFQFLSLSIWAQMVGASSGAIYQTLGKTKLMFISGLITTLTSVTAIIIGIKNNNIEMVAFYITLAYNAHFIINFFILFKIGFNYKFSRLITKIAPDFIVLMILSITFVIVSIFQIKSILLSFLIKSLFGLIGFVIGLLVSKQNYIFEKLIKKKNSVQ